MALSSSSDVMTAGSHSSGYRVSRFQSAQTTCHGISDIPMNSNTDGHFLVGTFPDDADRCHASFQMDGPDSSGISRLSMSQLLRPQELRFPDANMPTIARSPPRVSANGRSRSPGVSRLGMSRFSCPRESRFPDG
jgi:hypothetical protein